MKENVPPVIGNDMVVAGSLPLLICAIAAIGNVQLANAPIVPTVLIHFSLLKKPIIMRGTHMDSNTHRYVYDMYEGMR